MPEQGNIDLNKSLQDSVNKIISELSGNLPSDIINPIVNKQTEYIKQHLPRRQRQLQIAMEEDLSGGASQIVDEYENKLIQKYTEALKQPLKDKVVEMLTEKLQAIRSNQLATELTQSDQELIKSFADKITPIIDNIYAPVKAEQFFYEITHKLYSNNPDLFKLQLNKITIKEQEWSGKLEKLCEHIANNRYTIKPKEGRGQEVVLDDLIKELQTIPGSNVAPNFIQTITGWIVGAGSSETKLDEGTQLYNTIAGVAILSEVQKNDLIKQLNFTLDASKKQEAEKSFVSKIAGSVIERIFPQDSPQQKTIDSIKSAIHETFAQDQAIKTKIELFKTDIYKTAEIADEKLRVKLEQELADAIINLKKHKNNIDPIPTFTDQEKKQLPESALKDRLDLVINRIETAKLLTKLKAFENVLRNEQLEYIDSINTNILEIAKLQKEYDDLHESRAISESVIKERGNIQEKIKSKQEKIKDIIVNINLYSSIELRENFGVGSPAQNSNKPNFVNSIKDILKNNSMPNIVAAATVGGAVAYFLPLLQAFEGFIGNLAQVPSIGPYVAPLAQIPLSALVVSGGVLGIIFGNKVPVLATIFKPGAYVLDEIYDIWTNPNKNSFLERAVRLTAILAPIAGAAVGVGFLLAAVANPFSGPVIAGVVLGTVATFGVSALCGWAAKNICNKITRALTYSPSKAMQFCGNNKDEANKLSAFFKKHITEYENRLKQVNDNNTATDEKNKLDEMHIHKILAMLKNCWEQVAQNKEIKEREWQELLKVLYYNNNHNYQQELAAQVKISDDVIKELIQLVEAPKAIRCKEATAQLQDINKRRENVQFSRIAVDINTYLAKPIEELAALHDISKIFKKV